MRLVGNDDGDEGRLEVCVNGAWGTVCSDEFDSSDAAVACEALGGFNGSGKHTQTAMTSVIVRMIESLFFLQKCMSICGTICGTIN